jgi:hypothetical protein
MSSVFKQLRANNVLVGVSGSPSTISTSSSYLSLNSASSGDVRVNYDLPASNRSIATKIYVDSVTQGLSIKGQVRAKTTAALPAFTYNNGAGTITSDAQVLISSIASTFDGISLVLNDRVLVSSEPSGSGRAAHGLYSVTNIGGTGTANWVLTRTTDADNVNAASVSEIKSGLFVFVTEGTVNVGTGWILTTPDPITLGTTELVFTQFSQASMYSYANIGTGTGIFSAVVGSQVQFKSLATTSISTTNTTYALETTADSTTITSNFDQSKITGTGILTSGSINWSGNISTSGVLSANTGGSTYSTLASGYLAFVGSTDAYMQFPPDNSFVFKDSLGTSLIQLYGNNNARGPGVEFTATKIYYDSSNKSNFIGAQTFKYVDGSANDLFRITASKITIDNSVLQLTNTTAPAAGNLEVANANANALRVRTIGATELFNIDTSTSIASFAQGLLTLNKAGSGNNKFNLLTNLADALRFTDGTNVHLHFDTTTGAPTTILTQPAELNSGTRFALATKLTASGTLTRAQRNVPVETGASSLIITLPSAASHLGREYIIYKSDSGAGSATITPTTGDYLNDIVDDTLVLSAQYDIVKLLGVSNQGSNYGWLIL